MNLKTWIKQAEQLKEFYGEPVSVYTREQAIEDGGLVDVSELARQARFTAPLCITRGVHAKCTPPKGSYNDYTGRLWDVLRMARYGFKLNKGDRSISKFVVKIERKNEQMWLAFNDYEGFTIMFPDEY